MKIIDAPEHFNAPRAKFDKRYSVTANTANKSRTIYKAEGGLFGEKAPKSRQRGGTRVAANMRQK